jgi:hypothetical protein
VPGQVGVEAIAHGVGAGVTEDDPFGTGELRAVHSANVGTSTVRRRGQRDRRSGKARFLVTRARPLSGYTAGASREQTLRRIPCTSMLLSIPRQRRIYPAVERRSNGTFVIAEPCHGLLSKPARAPPGRPGPAGPGPARQPEQATLSRLPVQPAALTCLQHPRTDCGRIANLPYAATTRDRR